MVLQGTTAMEILSTEVAALSRMLSSLTRPAKPFQTKPHSKPNHTKPFKANFRYTAWIYALIRLKIIL
jgi:hypothetical protein